ncbi:MAG: transporter permease [Clostridiales bacterium]|jgi:ABC-2 type transport system permease protein|nr:transporter permease [Clostridiales bacterium]
MLAIFKRELKSYFYSPIAYSLIGLYIILSSVFFMLVNLYSLFADFTGTLSTMGFLLIFIIPILTMRILAEDRKNGTEVLLTTSPASLTDIVLGKYLATLCVFLLMTVLTFVYPIILSIFGKPPMPQIIGAYIGFILLGISFISVGVFASSLTESQIVAAIISFVSLLVMWLMDSITLYIASWAAKILSWFSLMSRYQDFSRGIVNLADIIYYLSFTVVFIFLTVRVLEKRRWSQG